MIHSFAGDFEPHNFFWGGDRKYMQLEIRNIKEKFHDGIFTSSWLFS
jgi:hypothetical protein